MAVPVDIIENFIQVKQFARWMINELSNGMLLLDNTENDRQPVLIQLRIALKSKRPHEVADIMHSHILSSVCSVLDFRVMEICSMSADVACFFDDPEAELHIP